jgi:nitrogen-specific signal transduction histidine kinase
MESNFGLANSDSAINLQSRATLARLRPAGVLAFPAGPQSVLEDLVRDAPAAMALLDKDCRHLEVSDEYCVQLQSSRTAIIGKTFRQLLSALPIDFEYALSRAVSGESVKLEGYATPTLGQECPSMVWKLRPWRKTRKRVGGVVLFLHDMGLPIPLDKEQRGAVGEQSQVDEKLETTYITAAKLAHDFNNALLVILGYSSLLMDELQPETEIGGKAASIFHAAERAAKLADTLLALSHNPK